MFDECWVVFEAGSPFLVCFRIPDDQHTAAAVQDPPPNQSNYILNHG